MKNGKRSQKSLAELGQAVVSSQNNSLLINRRLTRAIMLGQVKIGGGAPISVQTMTKTRTGDIRATVRQIRELEQIGCDIIRVAVPDMQAARALPAIRRAIHIPLVADIHFDYRLALAAIDGGVDGLRLNPGNIGSAAKVKEVVRAAAGRNLPIRVGVNSGSLEKDILAKHGAATPAALAESALRHVRLLEDAGHRAIKISVKASDVTRTVAAYRLLSKKTKWPLHLGVTEAGTLLNGAIRSGVALGILLAEGIGDTIRVSLSDTPANEVRVGREILRSLGLSQSGINVIACPTCGRTQMDVIGIAQEVEIELEELQKKNPQVVMHQSLVETACPQAVKSLPSQRHGGTRASRLHKSTQITDGLPQVKRWPTVAVMGCVVNGPGEAREADIALVCGKNKLFLYIKGVKTSALDAKSAPQAVAEQVIKLLG